MIRSYLGGALALCSVPLLAGCISTAAKVVTAPVRVVGKTADMLTTSQSEADEKRGRQMRQNEERLGDLDRRYQEHLRECDRGDEDACLKARDDYAEMHHISHDGSY